MKVVHQIEITPCRVIIDGRELAVENQGALMLKELYRTHIGNYPKFYKMDPLCRLGFVASELLLQAEGSEPTDDREDRAVVLVGSSASQLSDEAFNQTIQNPQEWFPSPAIFVYTLPNIVTGEIAMRNHYYGETAYYVLPSKEPEMIERLIENVMTDSQTTSVIGGWIDYSDKDKFEAIIKIWKN